MAFGSVQLHAIATAPILNPTQATLETSAIIEERDSGEIFDIVGKQEALPADGVHDIVTEYTEEERPQMIALWN